MFGGFGFNRCGCDRFRGFECGCGGFGGCGGGCDGGWGFGGFRGGFGGRFRGKLPWRTPLVIITAESERITEYERKKGR